ncbi:crystallin J1A-like [Babylonia areolata]|uniref:crystallin J1A-like n=1 Tax=Babylonia areolata TaxID=304850 RepID=UPI003FD59D03
MSAAVNGRRVAAVVGALVADAAAQPLHWIYDESKLKGIIGDKEEVEFWEPSQNPFYRIPVGRPTCYGNQAYVILRSLVDKRGVDCEDLKAATYKSFGPESPYEDPENARYTVGKEDKINVKATLPISRPWRHGSIKHFLKNMEAGKEDTGSDTDDQIDCVLRMVPVCALYAGRADMLDRVEDVLRVTQNSDTAICMGLAAARVLEQYILHGKSDGVLEKVMTDLGDKGRQNPQELDRAAIGYLRQVQKCLDLSHHAAVTQNFRKD